MDKRLFSKNTAWEEKSQVVTYEQADEVVKIVRELDRSTMHFNFLGLIHKVFRVNFCVSTIFRMFFLFWGIFSYIIFFNVFFDKIVFISKLALIPLILTC